MVVKHQKGRYFNSHYLGPSDDSDDFISFKEKKKEKDEDEDKVDVAPETFIQEAEEVGDLILGEGDHVAKVTNAFLFIYSIRLMI